MYVLCYYFCLFLMHHVVVFWFCFFRGSVDFLVLTFLEFRLLEKKCSGRYLAYRKQYNFLLNYSDFFESMLFQFGLCMVAILKPVTRWESNEKGTAYHSGAPDYTPDVSSCCPIFNFLCIFSIYAYDSFVLFL